MSLTDLLNLFGHGLLKMKLAQILSASVAEINKLLQFVSLQI